MRRVTLPYDGEIDVYDWKEGIQIIKQVGRKSEKYEKKSGRDKTTYCCTVATFDIETSRVRNLLFDPKHQPEMFHYFSYPYCWQFMIDGKFIFGQDPQDFFTMLDRSVGTGGTIIIYIHNITYEYNNLADYFLKNPKYCDIFFKNKNTPLYIKYRNFEFRCSALLTHKSLAKLGEEINYNKLKGDLDYSIPRGYKEGATLSPEELNYCYRDVAILEKWCKQEAINYNMKTEGQERVNPCILPYTQTGYPRTEVKNRFSKTKFGRDVLNETALEEQDYIFIHPAFYGGYTHENMRYVGKVIRKPAHRDITSAYPAHIVLDKYPYALHRVCKPNKRVCMKDIYKDDVAIIARIRFNDIVLKRGGIPYAPYSPDDVKYMGSSNVIYEGGKMICAESYEATLCDVDIRIILDAYEVDVENIEIFELYSGVKKRIPNNIVKVVLEFFEGKTKLKGVVGREYDYALSKQMLNAIYGLTAQALENVEYTLNGLVTDTVKETDGKTTYVKYEPARVMPYQWCIYITAYVREAIYSMIGKLESTNDFYYSDTDSIFYKSSPYNERVFEEYNKTIISRLEELKEVFPNIIPCNPKGKPQYLGTMLLEDDDCLTFCTVGSKRYYIKHPDGTVDITISGLSATKTWYDKDENGKEIRTPEHHHNGRNTERLIKKYGSIQKVFTRLAKDNEVSLDYEDGTDKMSNYNTRFPFVGLLCGEIVQRPCSYLLYGVPVTLNLNKSIAKLLSSIINHNIEYEIVTTEVW